MIKDKCCYIAVLTVFVDEVDCGSLLVYGLTSLLVKI